MTPDFVVMSFYKMFGYPTGGGCLLVRNEAPVCPHCGSQRLEKLLSAPNVAGKSKKIIESARSQAAREGHFSHYSRSEKPRR